MMAVSRVGASFMEDNCFLISSFQSGIFSIRDAIDGFDKRLPAAALGFQDLLTSWSQFVITPAPLSGFFYPFPLNPATLFQSVEQRVQRRDGETQHPLGARLDEFADFVAVA